VALVCYEQLNKGDEWQLSDNLVFVRRTLLTTDTDDQLSFHCTEMLTGITSDKTGHKAMVEGA